eukprot:scaffold1663_cov171-Amphora_coffeaeformis.AAC.4
MKGSVPLSLFAVALLSDIVAIRGIPFGRGSNSHNSSTTETTDNTFVLQEAVVNPPVIRNVDQRSTRILSPSTFPNSSKNVPTGAPFSGFGGQSTDDQRGAESVQNSARERSPRFIYISGDNGNGCQVSDDGQCISTDDDSGLNQWYPIIGGCVFRITSAASVSAIGSFDISDDILRIDYSSSNTDTVSMEYFGTSGPTNLEVKQDTLFVFEMAGSFYPPGTGFTICIDHGTQAPFAPSSRPTTYAPSTFPSATPSAVPTTELPRFFLISGDEGHDCQVSNDGQCISSDSNKEQFGEAYIPLFSCTFGITRSAEVSTVSTFQIADDALIIRHESSGESIEFKEPMDGFSSLSVTEDTTITFQMKSQASLDLGFTICIDRTSQTTNLPSVPPSESPSSVPSFSPPPSIAPSKGSSPVPSAAPSKSPSVKLSTGPTYSPIKTPSLTPISIPSFMPSDKPSAIPTSLPTETPSATPTGVPSSIPTNSAASSSMPSAIPKTSNATSGVPSGNPTYSQAFSSIPSGSPTVSVAPSTGPSSNPTYSQRPSISPTESMAPSGTPSLSPSRSIVPTASNVPTSTPTVLPSSVPSTSAFPSSVRSSSPSSSLVPSNQPSSLPTKTAMPSLSPSCVPTLSLAPSVYPSDLPTLSSVPSSEPSSYPSVSLDPSELPSSTPTMSSLPSSLPSFGPTLSQVPSVHPSFYPTITAVPSDVPSQEPTEWVVPSTLPSSQPTQSANPSVVPSSPPSLSVRPSTHPTGTPSTLPTGIPSSKPSGTPTTVPSTAPTRVPTSQPSRSATNIPSNLPTLVTTSQPSSNPSISVSPSAWPSSPPAISSAPISVPSGLPTESAFPSSTPSSQPSVSQEPSQFPSSAPTLNPSIAPSKSTQPSSPPSSTPTALLSQQPSSGPSSLPTLVPSSAPSSTPTASPSSNPSVAPSSVPTTSPSSTPTTVPSTSPSSTPSLHPTVFVVPTSSPSIQPSVSSSPTGTPSVSPTNQPSATPSASPSSQPSQFCEQNFFRNGLSESGTDLFLDIDGNGAQSAGDVTVFDSNTIQRAFMEPGFVSGWCKSLRNDDRSYCAMTFNLPEGLLFAQGLFSSMSILAGTDCYEDQKVTGTLSGSTDKSNKKSFTYQEVGFIPNLSCDDIYGDAWTATGFDTFVDADLSGDISPGDSYLLYDAIFENSELSRRAGTLTGECTILQDSSFDKRYCFLTVFIEGGSISVQGPFHSMLITGGTGCFANMSGMLSGSPDVSSSSVMSYKFLAFDQRKGNIAVQGFFQELAIVGSSGCFAGANGIVAGRVGVGRFEYNFARTSLYGNENLDDLSPETGDENSETCFPRDVPDLVGTWIGRDGSTRVVPNGRTGPGNIIVFEDSEIRNIDNPFISGKLSGRCTVLHNPETSIADEYYCVSDFAPEYGIAVFSGEFRTLSAIGATGCYTDVSATIAGVMYDEVSAYTLALDEPLTDRATCIPDSEFGGTWQQYNTFKYISYGDRDSGAKPGDKLLVNEKIYTPAGIQGRVKGDCTYLPEVLRNQEFCTLSFEFPSGTISIVGQFRSMVVTGGTGCYHGIRGTVDGSQVRNGAQYTFWLDNDTTATSCTTTGRFDSRLTESGPDIFFDADLSGAPSPGDSFLFDTHPVLAPNFTDGIAAGVCTLLGPRLHAYCTVVYIFDEGSIVTAGYFEYMTIVGGTGCYSGIKGQFRGRDEGVQSFSYEVVLFN